MLTDVSSAARWFVAAGAVAVAISSSSTARADDDAVPMLPDEAPARVAPLPDGAPPVAATDYLPSVPPPTGASAPAAAPRYRHESSDRGHPGLGLMIGGGAALSVGIPLLIGGAVLAANNHGCSELCFGAPIGGAMAVVGGVAIVTGVALLIAGGSAASENRGGGDPQGWARLAPAVVVTPRGGRLVWTL